MYCVLKSALIHLNGQLFLKKKQFQILPKEIKNSSLVKK